MQLDKFVPLNDERLEEKITEIQDRVRYPSQPRRPVFVDRNAVTNF